MVIQFPPKFLHPSGLIQDARNSLRQFVLSGGSLEFIIVSGTVDPVTEVLSIAAHSFVPVSGMINEAFNDKIYQENQGEIDTGTLIFTAMYEHVYSGILNYRDLRYARWNSGIYEIKERKADEFYGQILSIDFEMMRRANGLEGLTE